MDFDSSNIESALAIFDQSPNLIWWKDKEHRFRLLNKSAAIALGFESSTISFEGVTDFDIPCKLSEFAHQFVEMDNHIMQTKAHSTLLCFGQYSGSQWKMHICTVYPLLDSDNQTFGIAGSSVDITHSSLMKAALLLFDHDALFNKGHNFNNHFNIILKDTYEEFMLSARESECLFHYIRGDTAKEIAIKMKIAPGVVKNHLGRIKLKMGCRAKRQVVEKALHCGMVNILPKHLLLKN